ncbi:MAG: endolytic transglycosylase MltG [Magnetococcales bacterium]|nr:endolytic transglycosylase MltG [Nitrospirota bacterium]
MTDGVWPIKRVVVRSAVVLSVLITYIAAGIFMPLRFNGETVEIHIPRGATLRQAIDILSQACGMRNLTTLYLVGRMQGIDKRLRPGYYLLHDAIGPLEALRKFRDGDTIKTRVTIIPGHSLREIRPAMTAAGIIDFDGKCNDPAVMAQLKIDASSLEGYLLPETYIIEKGTPAMEVIAMMVRLLRRRYPQDFTARAKDLALSEHQVLTLASIIEKEAQLDTERPIISAVYHNRLRLGMPLQADPTAIYGLKGSGEGVSATDLRIDTPYNTYKIVGLPPGPIASPSLASIRAAIHPSGVPYLYFVAKKDGSHHFSTTYREHLDAIRRYQRQGVH